MKIGRAYLCFFFFLQKGKYESKFSASLFVWRYKETGGGEEVEGERREKQTHTHTERKKNKGHH